ncbi:MAG: flotillin family protein [bacterium]|nr:flotillin family protein [bacterium]
MGFFEQLQSIGALSIIFFIIIIFGILAMLARFYRKVEQGKVLIRNGMGGSKVSFSGMVVLPIIHRFEIMDIAVKRIEIERLEVDGLICQDNLRADIKVVFFVRVNQTREDVLKVAQSLGCEKASDQKTLTEFFDAKFSEALKTVGKQFDFVQLYNNRETFKNEILQVIGTDLNGYVLDDAAIDYLEQTDKTLLKPDNILDAEGIKKITDLTAKQAILSNEIERNKEKIIVEQDVSTREAVLELQKQQAEAEEKQKREIANIKSREQADAHIVEQEERLKAEKARIVTEEEVAVAEENKNRQIIVAEKNKLSTEAVETERVEKNRLLEQTEREKLVTLAQISKEKAVEEERKIIQDVIRERVIVEKATVTEEEKIKDTKAFAEADRTKTVAVTDATREAEQKQVTVVKAAEASKQAAELDAETVLIEAEAQLKASEKEAAAMKTIADAKAQEEAVHGLSEVRVMEARADAIEKEGTAKANVLETTANAEASAIEKKALAEAKGKEAMAAALEKEGTAEADVMGRKFHAEAEGINEKAQAMKIFDEAGKGHEEFKLELNKAKEIELAEIAIQKEIARAQAHVIGEALKSANIDIVGGETMFFEKIMEAVTQGKYVERLVGSSDVLKDVKETFFNGDPEHFRRQLSGFISQFNISSEDVKNLSISALLTKMIGSADGDTEEMLKQVLSFFRKSGQGDKPASSIL